MKIVITEKQLNKLININESIPNELIVFHGTNHKINKFSDEFVSGDKSIDANGPGIYFTDDITDSEHFGKIIYKVVLHSNNFISDKNKKGLTRAKIVKLIKMAKDWEIYASDWNENPHMGLNFWLNETINYTENSKDILLNLYGDFYKNYPIDFVRNCTKLGIDGINITNKWGGGGSSEHYVVYNPNIIEIINTQKNYE